VSFAEKLKIKLGRDSGGVGAGTPVVDIYKAPVRLVAAIKRIARVGKAWGRRPGEAEKGRDAVPPRGVICKSPDLRNR
jgi:hypothetical protein